jgi:undecaprenyl-diphosphatase
VSYLEAILLALVQGLTEFLPISSSAHLILVPAFLGWDDQGLAFDVAVHLGSLIAVCTYFRDEIIAVCRSWLKSVTRREKPDAEAMFGWYIGLATIPAGLVGLFFNDYIETNLRSPMVIAATTAIFGVALWLADRHGGRGKDEHSLTLFTAVLIGCAQAVALIPGTSRSGITITAGLALGLSRQAAARFSFLMAIPIIALASMLEIKKLVEQAEPVQWDVIVLGTFVSGVAAYLCIRVFLRLLERISMLPFAIYRVLLAVVIAVVFGAV